MGTPHLLEEEAKFLREAAGKVVTVSEIGDDSVEVTLTDEVSGMIHFCMFLGVTSSSYELQIISVKRMLDEPMTDNWIYRPSKRI